MHRAQKIEGSNQPLVHGYNASIKRDEIKKKIIYFVFLGNMV